MSIRKALPQILTTLIAAGAHSQTPGETTAQWKATISVVDEANRPVTNAAVEVWYYVKPPPDQTEASEKVSGLTGTSGVFIASHKDTGSVGLGFRASKAGYYQATKGHELTRFSERDAAKWAPEVTLLLKSVRQ